ncbi:GNAT family N-acetyltransferase [Proteiniclasticum sp. C24MP]|uniref:GNAT family N-acetyltransferase n=1 Tax=Proteiniclasticum sp. C24MP TaxID=3374101 RepID=UPI0037543F42
MSLIFRNYRLLSDFEPVSRFLRKNFGRSMLNGIVPQPYFEYAHTHPYFEHKLTHRFGLWEDADGIAAVACYEMNLGEALLMTRPDLQHLKPALLDYAEEELCKVNEDGSRTLAVFVFDYEKDLLHDLSQRGYEKKYEEEITVFDYAKGFRENPLPEGFTLVTLEEENDFRKINDVLWKGFNHGDEPDDDLDGRRIMQSGPHFSKELTTIVKAPNGEYACYAGMWVDGVNDFAYLEPLATDPKYRRMGLASIALTEAMKKTVKYGATYCFGGNREFYHAMGFETVAKREFWEKKW